MRSIVFIIVIMCLTAPVSVSAQLALRADAADQQCEEFEMSQGVDILEITTNNYLKGIEEKSSLERFVMQASDIEYWMGQFEFTEEVLKQISREEFYSKLEGWADEARYNYLQALENADEIRVMEHQVQIDDTPGLRINKKANIIIYLYQKGQLVDDLKVTLIECLGQFKLIQAQ